MHRTIMHIVEAPGGVERYLVMLLTKMKEYPETEHILVCSTSLNKEKFKGLVKSVTVIDSMHNPISVADMKAAARVRKEIIRHDPDIVYCHSSKAGAIARIANIGLHNKLIYNAHGWAFNMKGQSSSRIKLYETAEKMLAPLADTIVCISEYEKISALKHGICSEDKLVVINNGIDFDECRNLHPRSREELHIPKDAFVVGTVGRLTTQKAPDVFVKMASEVKKAIPNAFFIMVGDDIGGGHYREETESQINGAGLADCFLLTGWVSDPINYIQIFDVGVLLSRWEGFGLALPEYMFLGKPIVATKADAIPYVLGDAGLLVDIDNEKQAAEAVISLHDDRQLRDALIEREKERVKLFDVQRTADEHMKLFDQVVG